MIEKLDDVVFSPRRTIYEVENDLKEVYAEDPFSPAVYNAIFNLSAKIIVLKKLAFNRKAITEIAHTYATDLYNKLLGGLTIDSWTKYIMITIRYYVNKYYSDNNHEVIEIGDKLDTEKLSIQLYGSSRYNGLQESKLRDHIASIQFDIFDLVKKYSRYSDPWILRGLYLTAIASLRSDKITLVELNNEYTEYATRLVKMIDNKIRRSINESNYQSYVVSSYDEFKEHHELSE